MKRNGWMRPAQLAIGALALLAGAAVAAPRLAVLQAIAPGEWELHEIGVRGEPRPICVTDPRTLFQIVHGDAACAPMVLSDEPRAATVRYTCPGLGYGLTQVSVESNTIVRIQTQGLLRGAPFNRDYEARRTGACGRRLTQR